MHPRGREDKPPRISLHQAGERYPAAVHAESKSPHPDANAAVHHPLTAGASDGFSGQPTAASKNLLDARRKIRKNAGEKANKHLEK